jgi:hypothetical protein
MQTLGLAESTPHPENRLKSLFWPSVQTGSDVDYLGSQGYWVCTVVGLFDAVASALLGAPTLGVFIFLYFYLGGVGVRERSRYAAAAVFLLFMVDVVVAPGVLRILLAALLLSNLRATWIAASWKPDSEEAVMPPRLNETWTDKLADQFPAWLWPKVKIVYYIYSVLLLGVVALGVLAMMLRGHLLR